jgi:glycosyltransferase involved in cell wall biosynthesis
MAQGYFMNGAGRGSTTAAVPKVTIAIPTFNRADRHLRRAIGCALAQTYADIEVLVSDNCSSDNTAEVVAGIEDPRLRYVRHEKNIGANNNFNSCVREARGEYFLLLHDDDLIDPDFVDVCVEAAGGKTSYGVIRTGTRKVDGKGNILVEIPNRVGGLGLAEFFLGWFSNKTSLFLCSTLFNTQGLREIGGFFSQKQLFQDDVALFKLAAQMGRVDVPDVKASFRRHGENMCGSARISDWCIDSLYLLDLMCELAPEQSGIIRREGMVYFTKQNYHRAMRIRSPLQRWSSYLHVYRVFGSVYSPLQFATKQTIQSTKRFVRSVSKSRGIS